MKKACQITRWLILLCGSVALLVTGFSSVATADEEVDAGTIVVVSDDIMKKTTNVQRGAAAPDPAAGDEGDDAAGDGSEPAAGSDDGSEDGSGSNDNRSGLGDGTNPGAGDGTENATNDGTDNPNGSWSNWGRGRGRR